MITYQNRTIVKIGSSSTVNRAQPGQKGKVGLGGRHGRAYIFEKNWDNGKYTEKSYLEDVCLLCYPKKPFADSGIQPTECSLLHEKSREFLSPSLCQLETEYLKFMNEQNSRLIHSNLINRPLLYQIMNQTSEVPSLHQLIERVYALTEIINRQIIASAENNNVGRLKAPIAFIF